MHLQCTFAKLEIFLSVGCFMEYTLKMEVYIRSLSFQCTQIRLIFQVRPQKWLSIYFFFFKLSALNFYGFILFTFRIIFTSTTSAPGGLVSFLTKKLL